MRDLLAVYIAMIVEDIQIIANNIYWNTLTHTKMVFFSETF